ncbi:hypothetical protein HUT19_28205 [Streptomyces sp. NA02950]|uniref:DUF6299 family protein n=1 Tax=Streptomyces sp. NA02950 TaxID=2742137 RepID=UPI001590CACF|nr:DUF6299 family protein [Streptomyces sp. NA02950]QKV95143.1 hypothetical protein HUT19_28205 [Streptomyces sp. NA02950]
MRNRHRIVGAVAVVLISAPAAHATASGATDSDFPAVPSRSDLAPGLDRSAVPLSWGDSLTVDRTGYVTRGGTVTVYGSFRCSYDESDSSHASILVTVTQGAERHAVGAVSALCDGLRHRWVIAGNGGARYVRGPAYVDARMVRFGARGGVVPMPRTVADTEHEIKLISPVS